MLMHEYAYYGRGNTIHSPCQIEWFNNLCDDKSHHVGANKSSHSWMDMQPHYNVDLVSCV